MELEFDKEIDALLRKANRDSPAAAGVSVHLDADELAAFAENALPDRSRQYYVAHLADCDTCRKTLSGFIAMSPEAAADAASVSALPVVATKLPWYKRLFATPNLAYTMAALVLMFSGAIGLLVYQNQMSARTSQISRVSNAAPETEPQTTEDRTEYSANSMSNSTANTSSSSPIQSVTQTGVEVGSADTTTATSSASNSNASIAAAPPVAKNEENKPVDSLLDAAKNEPNAPAKQPAVAGAPATAAKEKDLTTDDRRELEAKKSAPKADQAEIARSDSEDKVQAQNSNAGRDLSPGANSAKLRAVGPRQVQSQSQNQMQTVPSNADLAANGRAVSNLKTAGGKKFEFRDGIWYDTAYNGQGKKDVKRGTDKFLRLDAGLRSIADQIGGTVVVVWNGQAYKIK
jgi:hypothetical protein